jgi:bifunctional non-homologous end joining protein LigD
MGSKLPDWIEPMLPSPVDEPTREKGRWLNELKLDGIRVLARKAKGEVRLFSRRGNSLALQFPEVAREVAALPAETVALDGEICVTDKEGRARFQLIQPRIHVASASQAEKLARTSPAVGFAFDLLHVDGEDLRRLPLVERKSRLKALLPAPGDALRYLEHVEGEAERFFELICEKGVEGMIQKRADTPYVSGRTRHWLKVKCGVDGEFVIAGFAIYESTGPGSLGGLLLGLHRDDELVYVGGVGTGWSETERRALRERLERHARADTPYDRWHASWALSRGKKPEKIVWLDPVLVCRIHYQELTDDGKVRGSSWRGIAEGADPKRVTWPREAPSPREADRGPAWGADAPKLPANFPKLTNPDKVFFPERGYTKGDLFRYYAAVASLLLPHLRDRPITLRRMPDGIRGPSFYQKNQGKGTPEWLRTIVLHSQESDRDVRYGLADDVGSLLYLIQLGCISLSPWSSRVGSLENPDFSIVDLDPGEKCTFEQVIEVARLVHEIVEGDLGLRCYPKTSGATGIHVMVPLEPRYTYMESQTLAEIVARLAESRRPDLCTTVRMVKARPQDKVYLDYLQNAQGKHVVSVYSVREVEAASVSTPLHWDEVKSGLRPDHFDIRNAPERFGRLGDLWRPVLEDKQELEGALKAKRK